jgi:hypothetical protein
MAQNTKKNKTGHYGMSVPRYETIKVGIECPFESGLQVKHQLSIEKSRVKIPESVTGSAAKGHIEESKLMMRKMK